MIVALLTTVQSNAQKTMDGMQLLTVNENITTVITASEPVRFVDISTDKVVGDQPINNTIRLKPKEGVEVPRRKHLGCSYHCDRAIPQSVCVDIHIA